MARRELGREQVSGMSPVGLDHEQSREAAAQQLVVEAVTVDDHIGEPPAVDVPRFHVALQTHEASGEPRGRVRGGLRTEALDTLRGVMRLGCVDAQDSDGVGASVRERDHDGVAIERLDHTRPGPRGTALITEPPAARRSRGHHDDERRDGAPTDHGSPTRMSGRDDDVVAALSAFVVRFLGSCPR